MTQLTTPTTVHSNSFLDRRNGDGIAVPPGVERRQFASSYHELSPAGREIALAIDEYKVRHRRRFITYDEMLHIIQTLGYNKTSH
jgi:hypothetical protein